MKFEAPLLQLESLSSSDAKDSQEERSRGLYTFAPLSDAVAA